MLGVLRDDDGAALRSPRPGLGRPRPARRATSRPPVCPSRSRVEGEPTGLPPGVDLTAYRDRAGGA